MLLTREQEQELIERNMPKIYRAVDNFTARCTADVIGVPYDEFVQEVAIAFLLYARKCKKKEDLDRFPWYSAMGAMRSVILRSQPMSCDHSTHRFKEIIHSMPSTVSLDVLASSLTDINGMAKHWVDDKETMLDFEAFMDGYDENTKRIASMRYGGMNFSEIADQYGVPASTIMRRIRRLADDYHDFNDEEDENGK